MLRESKRAILHSKLRPGPHGIDGAESTWEPVGLKASAGYRATRLALYVDPSVDKNGIGNHEQQLVTARIGTDTDHIRPSGKGRVQYQGQVHARRYFREEEHARKGFNSICHNNHKSDYNSTQRRLLRQSHASGKNRMAVGNNGSTRSLERSQREI